MWVKLVCFSWICFLKTLCVVGHCVDIHSQIISQGLHYVPGPNSCMLCICDKGGPKWCKSVLCSQPQNCKSFQRGNSCCEFKCLDDILAANDNYKDTYDLALRLIASAVFIILTLSLLFFVVHRFRKHKLHVQQNSQLNEDQRSLNSIGYITGTLGYLPGNIGYLGSGTNDLEYHYEESNGHYSLWKPPCNYFPRGEAPPPYEEAIRSAQVDTNIIGTQAVINSAAPADVDMQQPQRRVTQHVPNPIQCKHQHLIGRTNTSQEYANVTVESVSNHQHADQLIKIEKSVHRAHKQTNYELGSNHSALAKEKFSKINASTEKSKSCENKQIRKNDRSVINSNSNSDGKTAKQQTSQMVVNHEGSHIDKNNFKFLKYENVILRNFSLPQEIHNVRQVDKTQIENNCGNVEAYYENINPCYENTRHRTIPFFTGYQSKTLAHIRDCKSNDSTYVLSKNSARKFLDKTGIEDSSESNRKKLLAPRECRELPLHCTLPKNLKELSVSVSSSNESNHIFQKFGNSSEQKLLPKQCGNPDTVTVNLAKSQSNLTETLNKDFSSSKLSYMEAAASSRVGLLETKKEDIKSKEEDRSLISYRCLSSSQEEDDYRSECENCKSSEIINNIEDEEGDVFNETMTLQRRPETSEEVPYYRTSLTLPTQIRKPRAVTPNPSRNGWFMAMQETSSSEESE